MISSKIRTFAISMLMLIGQFAFSHHEALAYTESQAMADCQANADTYNAQYAGTITSFICVDVGFVYFEITNGIPELADYEVQLRELEYGINDCYYANDEWLNTDFCYPFPPDPGRSVLYDQILRHPSDPGCGVGNPINPGTGIKVQRETVIGGGSAIPFDLTYRSGDPVVLFFGNTQAPNFPFGSHWTDTYGMRIILVGNQNVGFAIRPDGRMLAFSNSSGTFRLSGETSDQIQNTVDSVGNVVGWIYTTSDDTIEQYDPSGRLLSITSRDGQTKTATYSDGTASGPNGATYLGTSTPIAPWMLLRVTDSFGRQISYSYNTTNQVGQITDSAGLAYRIGYDGKGNVVSITYPDNKVRQLLYNESVYTSGADLPTALTGIIDENNQRYATYTYDAYGDAIGTTHAGGAQNYTISWGSIQEPMDSASSAVVTDPAGTARTYTYRTLQNGRVVLASMSQPCPSCSYMSAQSEFHDDNANLTSKIDFNGNTTQYAYDLSRNLETQRIEALTGGGAATPITKTTTTQWHPNWRMPAAVAEPNRITTYVYNGDSVNGQQVLCAPADALSAGLPIGMLCSKTIQATTDANGSKAFGASLTGTPRTWSYTYNALGQTLTVIGPRTDVSDITTYTYYPSTDRTGCAALAGPCHQVGDLYTATNALGQVTTNVSYDANGRITRMRDSNGTYTDMTYHPRGWLLTRTVRANADGTANALTDATTTIAYDYVGNITKVTQPDGASISNTYDGAHRLTDISDNLGNRIHYTLDGMGNRTNEATYDPGNALKRSLSRQYDQLNLLVKTLNSAGSATQTYQNPTDAPPNGVAYTDGYDGTGNPIYSVDGLGAGTLRQYDALHRLIAVLQDHTGKSPATKNATTHYTYDAHGNQLSQTDQDNLATTYTYDAFDELTKIVSPDTGITTYSYDTVGNRLTQTDARGVTVTSTYDALNRVTSVQYPTASLNISYTYDQPGSGCFNTGRLTSINDNSGSASFCYDRRGNLLSKTQVTNGVSFKVSYVYTIADRLSSITYPSGALIKYGRDILGRVTSVQYQPSGGSIATLISNIAYYPFGPVNVITFANGRTLTKTYDQDYAIDKVVSSSSSGLIVDATVDVLGNVINASSSVGASKPTQSYTYDPMYRVTSVKDGSGNTLEAFSYNATGDRLSKTLGAQTSTYSYNILQTGHHLGSINGVARGYDLDGNTLALANGQLPAFKFDDRDRMASVHASNTPPTCGHNGCSGGSDVSAQYGYNARGERVFKNVLTTSGSTTTSAETGYVYGESGLLLGEYPAGTTNVSQREYIYLDGVPVAYATGGVLYYVESDQLGTPRTAVKPGATTSKDSLVWKWDYFANNSVFGENAPSVQTVAFNLRYPGQYFDSETGLNYNRARDYEPGTGRYMESDPIGLRGGPSTFAYVGDSPLGFTDPKGLAACCTCNNMVVKRRDHGKIAPPLSDIEWGHWWLEINGTESYGWWPKGNGSLFGCGDGVLNNQGDPEFPGTPTKDPHHGYSAEESFNPVITDDKNCDGGNCAERCRKAADCFREFAQGYKGKWCLWSNSCHQFQEQGMSKCGISKP